MYGKLRRSIVALALCAVHAGAQAQAWPTKSVRIVVPFTPGSGTDIIARTVTEKLSPQIGQAIVIENRPGAGGTIGVGLVAKAEPDGHTLLVHSSSYTVTPSTYKDLPYDTLRDLTGVMPLGLLPNVLVMAPSKGIRSVRELVAAAKAKPGSMNSASVNIGSATHLNAERFRLGAGIDTVNVPFKGSPEALTEIITGRVDYYFCPVVSVLPLLKDGKIVALAVGSTRRSSALPDLPTTLEAGVPNSDYNFWVGMFAPAKTPRETVQRLYRETLRALRSPGVSEKMSNLGAEPMDYDPDQFNAYIRGEIASNAALVKAAGIKLE
ncbi:MAG: tripartite tricarboxylate transporter substrate binding protein [Betaproteobacteria bacterium]|nr:MAG: tripartite tricarboxylate transporter substrate binding protein [Betaproteobacteria bacterium]TMG79190.1 MAG: tripartite tricarboxylate transporter substrate binding protein [Betaproteobacteria bacterium]